MKMALELIRTIEAGTIKETFERIFKTSFNARVASKKSGDIKIDEEKELISLIKNTRDEWLLSILCFDNMTDCEMLDYYAYQIKAYELKFEYLLKKAKKKGVKANLFDGL